MYTIQKIKQNIVNKINNVETHCNASPQDLVLPPNPEMGDLSYPCFNLAKSQKKNPAEIASELAKRIKTCQTVKEIKAVGPYLNFTLQPKKLAQEVIGEIKKKGYGAANIGKNRKIIVEFAHPNTHKAFHIGHLRNIITGEAVCRILENAGYKVTRANYQGDVGLHIAKCLWGITQLKRKFAKAAKEKDINKKAAFLGKAYAFGSGKFEANEEVKKEIKEISQRIYNNDESIREVYLETRKWSLDYFAKIYKRVNTKFDRLYFESEVFADGKKIVMDGMKKGIFKASEGAIIFEGDKHGLHNRVFINSESNPTYEAKDMALAKLQFKEYNPDKIIHVVGPEQKEYFKVIIKALEYVLPKSKEREQHLPYGWVRLKEGKMSSRLGNVILGEWLLDEVKKEIAKIVKKNKELDNKNELSEKISLAAVKYSILKTGLTRDIAFDIKESISLSGNSGPYLLYTYARIQSILRKVETHSNASVQETHSNASVRSEEKNILFKMSLFPEVARESAEKLEPSLIARHLFELSQQFNDYYHATPVLKAEKEREFRLALIRALAQVLKQGIELLGFETVEKM
ncbi:arginine--tRNA ligase [Candidatus Falkowbacteria bacterium CG10_big_fil_rev_8_21_14_0_10_43_10]|uniref:Arginine--tRNA ligase n=1 Tax=Candidatus Falkowbacteria bacterium CG10_big_fil_rev_8_21_14_0_10_43_10 TaxID=1974567 RepID=A0A2H0V1L7_9BACT|nr:MAG: arginine--tRNA ligase [Candidatus Falkowbacteria bacterium CG10_big_fil_rev_8_21_14_0_10_43_10]